MESKPDNPWTLALIAVGIAAVIGLAGLTFRACSEPKLDEAQIQRNKEAVASGERKKMENAYAETKLVEANIDANRAYAENKKLKVLHEGRVEANAMSDQQLAEYLEGR
jgi:hypothetical protein